MKKYLLGIVALVLAVSFSAFSSEKTFMKKPSSGRSLLPALYWYEINPDGSLGNALNSGTQMIKTDALAFTPCQDITSTDCDRGYSSPQTVGANPAPATNPSVDYHILKNQ